MNATFYGGVEAEGKDGYVAEAETEVWVRASDLAALLAASLEEQ